MREHLHGEAFAGVGGFGVGAGRHQVPTAWTSETDKAARRVLESRLPEATHHGSIVDLVGRLVEPVTILSGGSPCQNFSLAGNRKGLGGTESALFGEYARLIGELRERGLRWAVWENVTGALNANRGEDFANVIAALVGGSVPLPLPKHPSGRRSRYAGVAHGPWGTLAWRTLDAQNFGVPQRRQRVIALLSVGSWKAAEALFPGYRPVPNAVAPVVFRGDAWAQPLDLDAVPFDTGMAPFVEPSRLADVLEPDAPASYDLSAKACVSLLERGARHGKRFPEPMECALRMQGAGGGAVSLDADWPTAPVTVKMRAGKPGGGKGPLLSEDLSLTLSTGNDQYLFQPIPFDLHLAAKPGNRTALAEGRPAQTLDARRGAAVVQPPYRVRRLTPVECERLQGFHDGWTDVPGAKDANRYRQMGNAVAVPVACWTFARITTVDA